MQVKVGGVEKTILDEDFVRLMYLFVLCTTLFRNSYYNINPKHLSTVEDLKTFEVYAWGIDVLDNILLELQVCKEGLPLKRQKVSDNIEGSKSKMVSMEGCDLILHYFVIEHIPGSGLT